MSTSIQHKGRVVAVSGSRIDVKMTVEGACSSCRVKNICGMGESEERVVTVNDAVMGEVCRVGDEVVVSITDGMGMKAVVYSYILPFFVMVAVMITLALVQSNELVTGLSTLGACALYYIGLYIFRDRIEKEIEFKIDKLTE